MPQTKLKTLYLLDILREYTDEEHRLSVPELVNKLDERGITAERKGIYRDIEALLEHGEDIVKTATGYYLGKRTFHVAELRLLISAVQAAGFITEERSAALIDKLAACASRYDAQALRQGANMGGVKCGNDEVLRTIETLNHAISAHRQVTFAYYKQDVSRRSVVQRSGKRFRVNPYALIWMQDRYYLVGNMDERDDLTHFRLDRMRSVYIEQQAWRHFSEVSPYTSRFDQADYVKKCVNMFGGETRFVTLRCENGLASDVFDRFGNDAHISRESETHFRAIVEVSVGGGFLAWVAQWGARMEIVAPAAVRLQMRERLAETAALYAD